MSGRVPIVTDVGGSREVVEDEVTGFLAAGPAEDAVDEAMVPAYGERGVRNSAGFLG